ncbi:uncharacterized protein LOC115885368 [Sitophilus oryzae]|uniref:Uncharacterized protein LOC115885368 n=1 Tax=Sitophilus oryzae TaxID=7048 RepID=A0A6J2Y9E2_SITOR|nr:uncharacterized protein LOC115885368 [Sitophilus oryzae]
MFQISFIFVITLTTVLSSKLPENFLALGENYVYSVALLDFFQSYAACKRFGWTLATEKNERETTILAQEIKANGLEDTVHWLGGFYQIDKEFIPRWMWLETGESFNYTHWYGESQTTTSSPGYKAMSTHPGKATASSNLCLEKYGFKVHDGQWVATNCEKELYFICQIS